MSQVQQGGATRGAFGKMAGLALRALPKAPWKISTMLFLGFTELAVIIALPLTSARIINSLVAADWPLFRNALLQLSLLTFSQAIVNLAHQYVLLTTKETIGNNLRRRVVESVLAKSLPKQESYWVGDIISRALNDASGLKGFITDMVLQPVYDTVTLVVVVVVLFRMNPVLAALTVATAPITLITGKLFRSRIRQATLKIRESMARVTGKLQSWLSKPFQVKADFLERPALRQFMEANNHYTANSISAGKLGVRATAINIALLGIPGILIFAYGGSAVIAGKLSVGALFAFATYAAYFNAPIQRLIGTFVVSLPALYPLFERVHEICAEPVSQERENISGISVTRLRINDGVFSYQGEGSGQVFIPSMELHQGEIVGLTGANGSGKTTLLKVIAGLYPLRSGQIQMFSGAQELASQKARALCRVMCQHPALFDGTLLENITSFDDQPREKDIAAIADELGLEAVLKTLPQGWQTAIHADSPPTFSSGQIQKLALARALYLPAQVLLLDEPSAAFDRETLARFKRMIKAMHGTGIVVIVSHSEELLAHCDKVYLLEKNQGSNRFTVAERSLITVGAH